MEFITLTIVSVIVVILILRFTMRSRKKNPLGRPLNLIIIGLVTIISMIMGKYGAGWGLPWWIYYTSPMLLTIVFPMIYFEMRQKEILSYVILTFLSAPAIHIIFSFFAGWKNYMPFIPVPSIWEMVQ